MTTTNHDLERLRGLAAEGVFLTVAARSVGMSDSAARYWNEKEHLGLVGRAQENRFDRSHPAPDILAVYRLHLMMEQLAWQTSQSSRS